MAEADLFRVLTLLLAVTEQALLELDRADPPREQLRAAVAGSLEELYAALAWYSRSGPAVATD